MPLGEEVFARFKRGPASEIEAGETLSRTVEPVGKPYFLRNLTK